VFQVLGELISAHDIGDDDVLILGRDGMLLAGPNSKLFESQIMQYVSLLARELCIRNYFLRLFVLDDTLKKVRGLVQQYESDPANIPRIRSTLNEASKDIILLVEVLAFLEESMRSMGPDVDPRDEKSKKLAQVLNCAQMRDNITLRISDMRKLIDGASQELVNLSSVAEVINVKILEDIFRNVEGNTKQLVDAGAVNERSAISLSIIQTVLTASLAFDIIDRISGGTLGIDAPDWVKTQIVGPLVEPPGVWFLFNMGCMIALCAAVAAAAAFAQRRTGGVMHLRYRLNRSISVADLEMFVSTRAPDLTQVCRRRLELSSRCCCSARWFTCLL